MTKLIEVENKRELKNVEKFREILRKNGFVKEYKTREIDTYFSRPDVDFMKTVECLRIREKKEFCELTYKPASSAANSTGGTIAKHETNVPISRNDVPVLIELLANLDMKKLAVVDKTRAAFVSRKFPGLTVAIDDLAGVGFFVETEVMSENEKSAREILAAAEKLLGVENFAKVKLPYRDLVMIATGEIK